MINCIKELLDEQKWAYLENDNMIKFDVDGENGTWPSFIKYDDESVFLYYGVVTNKVPEDKREKMSMILSKINYGLKVGNFEMDLSTGSIHFKTYAIKTDDTTLKGILQGNIIFNMLTMDRYLPVILKAIYSDVDVYQIINEIE